MGWSVYKHTNLINQKVYIGITSRKPSSRWGLQGKGYKDQPKFFNAIEKYGWENFKHEISQLNQNRTMKDTELLYSEDLGTLPYSGRKVHCCLNIYHYCKNGHKQNYDIPGILECRHIFRTGKYKHPDDILNYPWDFRVSAWGTIKLLDVGETCPNEIVFRCDDNIKEWLEKKLKECNYKNLLQCVASPNLPAWRLRKWLKEQWEKERGDEK